MLKLKFFQRGKKHQRTYRLVVAEARDKRDGKFVDDLGWWNPRQNEFKINQKKLKEWQEKGAQLTKGARKILKNINPKKK